jgi:hypothetical protein
MRQALVTILLTAVLAGPAAAQDLRTPDAREPYRSVPPVQEDLRSPDAREPGASSRTEGSAAQAADAAEWIYLAIAGAGLTAALGAAVVGERKRRRTVVAAP